MVTTRPPKTIVKPTALGPVANTDTKLLIYGLFQKGRVLAQDGVAARRLGGGSNSLVEHRPTSFFEYSGQLITKSLRAWMMTRYFHPYLFSLFSFLCDSGSKTLQ